VTRKKSVNGFNDLQFFKHSQFQFLKHLKTDNQFQMSIILMEKENFITPQLRY